MRDLAFVVALAFWACLVLAGAIYVIQKLRKGFSGLLPRRWWERDG